MQQRQSSTTVGTRLEYLWVGRVVMLVVLSLSARPGATAEPNDARPRPPVLATTAPKPPAITPPAQEELDAAIDRGVEFLLESQNPNGSWGSCCNTKALNIYAPVPGAHHAFQIATTSLCVSALVELELDDPRVDAALDRAEAYFHKRLPHLRRSDPTAIYNNWGHAYAIQALVRLLSRHEGDPDAQEALRKLVEQQIDRLGRYECVDGGWCYYDFDYGAQHPAGSTISFVTAAVLVAFRDAREAGFEIPQRLVDRGKASILRQRKPDFSYCYGEYLKQVPMMGVNLPAGSLGRSQACNIAMRYWGDPQVTDEVLTAWLDRLFARNGWLGIGRKRPVPHESWFQVAGYFYYFGHYYAGLCIDALPADRRVKYQDYMAHTLLKLQEADGSWWDYPLYDYHRPYGTGFALMTLLRCRHDE